VKGLALSGGGARGSFQVGALESLYKLHGYQDQLLLTHTGAPSGTSSALIRAEES
jgi:predicted acylesterase/phospholipase RssA